MEKESAECYPAEFEKPAAESRSSSSRPERLSTSAITDDELLVKLDGHSLESIVELKISRFLDQLGTYYPDNLYNLIMRKMEKPLLHQILRRTGGNQVHASRILGINRNTLRKKIKLYSL
ncbi:MAG: DNA-binding protein [Deltaproteobacteria bacterium]|nr:DNA-binding protein [Deltaproteobacteria bacterium]